VTRQARRRTRSAAAALVTVAAAAVAASALRASEAPYVVKSLVSDGGVPARVVDRSLVNAWGIAASPTGPWWTGNEATDTSTLYAGSGQKQLLTVKVDGGPTGVAWHGGRGLLVRAAGRSDPARFVYACEDGRIRAWTPTVPVAWSSDAVVVVDAAAEAAVFRGVAIAGDRVYATDFHNARVDVFDAGWRRLRLPSAFVDQRIPEWYAPAGIVVSGRSVFVSYVWRAPVNGNDAPSGGFVDEYDLDGRLLHRVARGPAVHEPWGMARAPRSFGRFGGDLLVASFGTGHIDAFRRTRDGWRYHGVLAGRHGPLVVNGVWGIAFGNGGLAGGKDTLFAAAGPHRWHGASELGVHGLLASIEPG
jgi:uncharacterized protein (TIGR03118 family)